MTREEYIRLRYNEAEQKKAAELYEQLGQRFWSVVGPANYSAVATMLDAIDVMEDAGIVRQKLKQLVKRAQRQYQEYVKAARDVLEDRFYLWQDMTAHAHDRLRPDILKLFFGIKQHYDNFRIPDSNMLAHLQTTFTMLSLCTGLFDATMDFHQRQTYLDISSYFKRGRLTGIVSIWNEVMELVIPKAVLGMPLAKDPNCKTAVSVIARRYETMEFLDEAATDAMRLNPSMIKYANEEDRQFFTDDPDKGEGGL